MKDINNCTCPNCSNKLLEVHSIFVENDIMYNINCVWCNWKSKQYNGEQEAINNYENEIL